MKTTTRLAALVVLLGLGRPAVCEPADPTVKTAEKPDTLLYVRTTPPGAKVLLDGKELGTTDGLFKVEPGVRRIVVELEDHDPKGKEVTIHASRITRLVLKLKKRPEAVKAPPEKATWGPVIERVITGDVRKASSYLDLDTGDYVNLQRNGLTVPLERLRQKGVDLYMSGLESHANSRTATDMVVAELSAAGWNESAKWTMAVARARIAGNLKGRLPSPGRVISVPGTYIFRTREGNTGVLQLLGRSKDNAGIKIRYRLVKKDNAEPAASLPWTCSMHPQVALPKPGKCPLCATDLISNQRQPAGRRDGFGVLPGTVVAHPAAKKVFLPDADTPGAETILDLASGKTLTAPKGKAEAILRQLKQWGMGDLAFDRALVCLRGAKARWWNGAGFVALPSISLMEDTRGYKLPSVPCRLLITTAEKKHFDVTILSVTDDGGINLEYHRAADPALVPEEGGRHDGGWGAATRPAAKSIASPQPKLTPRKLFSASHGADVGILAVAFSPDGQTIAAVDEQGKVILCDAKSGRQSMVFHLLKPEEKKRLLYEDRQGRIHTAAIAFSPDGYTLAVGADPVVRLYDAQTARPQRVLQDKQLIEELKGLGRPPATVSREIELLGSVPHAHGRVFCVAFSPDGTLLATSGLHLIRADGSSVINAEVATHGKLKLWDAKTGELKRDLGEHYSFVQSAAFSPDGKTLASIGSHPPHWTRSVRLWDPQTGAVKSVLAFARGGMLEGPVVFSPDGELMAVSALFSEADPNDPVDRLGRLGGGVCRMLIWKARTGELLFNRRAPGLVTSLSFSADSQTLATAVDRQGVTLWDPETLKPKGQIQLSADPPRDVQVAFSPTGNLLAIGAKNEKHGFVTVWKIPGPPY